MAAAGFMLAHQVAAKALRDAAFFSVWDPSRLPLMVAATAVTVVAMVPFFARALERSGPRVVVPIGFFASALLHLLEWQLSSGRPWVAVLIYLHVAGFGALLLSGFWSMVSERFDPRGARTTFGTIAAAGTVGGLLGGAAAERFSVYLPIDAALPLLAALHVTCALLVLVIGRAPVLLPVSDEAPSARLLAWHEMKASPHLRTIALIVLFSTAGAGLLDYLLKWQVTVELGRGPHLFRFFAIFYGAVQLVTFLAQTRSSRALQRLGVGAAIATLPAGSGGISALALLFPGVVPVIVLARGVEAVLRGSLFRSAYELLFVPMDTAERRRMKTFLDVTCDRAGEALGAAIIGALLVMGDQFLHGELLAITIGLAVAAYLLSRRLDRLYLGVVEQQLVKHVDKVSVVVSSDVSWTVLDLARPLGVARAAPASRSPSPPKPEDQRLRLLGELRSGDRIRVEAALRRLTSPDRIQVAQVIQLLAWDDVVGSARTVLEAVAPAHVGLLVDELLDPDSDFSIRRRIPRILGTVLADRALDGLCRGLDDSRFEVRYQCGRAIDRLLRKAGTLPINKDRMLGVIERELSVPLPVWQGHRLIDHIDPDTEPDDDSGVQPGVSPHGVERNLEHIFTLLGTVLPRDAVRVAFRGIQSADPGLRGLAIEYLEGVLPGSIASQLTRAVEIPATREPRADPETALEALRRSTETPILGQRAEGKGQREG